MQIVDVNIEKLIPYDKNPRNNSDAINYVANSIAEFGFKVPIVIDKDYTIVCGHTRWLAAKQLELKSVPCIMADDLTPKQIKAFRLADNKVSEIATWDFDLLNSELKDLLDFDMSKFNFLELQEPVEIDDFLEEDTKTRKTKTIKCPHCEMEFEV